MAIHIVGDIDINRLYCAGSFTKLLTTYVSLSLLAEKYDLYKIVDDENFLDTLCVNPEARSFLTLFQKIMGSKFTIRDLCSYYSGLPYTFDLADEELERVDANFPFKHHSILDEKTFLFMCQHKITPVYPTRCKFHYSEISIIFLGYLIEKIYDIRMEDLYQKFIFAPFGLQHSYFSRKRVKGVFCEDLSDKYDYPSIAILDHGYFCYSNGYYTTLSDMKILIEHMLETPVFKCMVDVKYARAASNRLMNGLTIELRMVGEDLIYGYEGLSFSGCNIWAYSTQQKQGYLTLTNSEEDAYDIYDQFGYKNFDKVPEHTQKNYQNFIRSYQDTPNQKMIPPEYQGHYQRVKINEKNLKNFFELANNFMIIRNPDEIKYDIVYADNAYRIKCKDNIHGGKIGLYQAKSGNHYMMYDGTLYRKMIDSPSS
jgi:hypothetical protein